MKNYLEFDWKITLGILTIILPSFLLRMYRIDQNIPSLYIDETFVHYLKYITLTDFSQPVYKKIYDIVVLAPATYTWIFGLTPLGVRLPSVIYSTIIVFLMFVFSWVISMKLGGQAKVIAFVSALLAAVLPWNFMIGRIGHTHITLMLMMVLIYLILFAAADNFRKYLVAVIPLALALFYYQSMIIIFPIILLLTLYYVFWQGTKNQRSLVLVVAILGLVLVASRFLYSYQGIAIVYRAFDLAIWRDVNTSADSDTLRGFSVNSSPSIFSLDKPPNEIVGLVFNKPIAILNIFFRNYLSFFSPDFLFLKGDPVLRHATGHIGYFFPILIPFLIYGIYLLAKSKQSKIKSMFLIWILISPIPASITKDGSGYLLRAITMMPFLTYLVALGLVGFYHAIKRFNKNISKIYLILISTLIIYSSFYFYFGYFHFYPTLSARSFEYGFKELADFQSNHNNESLLVVWDGYYPHFHFRFWQKTPGQEFKAFTPSSEFDGGFHQTFPNLYFLYPKQISKFEEVVNREDIRYIALPENLDINLLESSGEKKLVEKIYYPSGSVAFSVYELSNYETK